MTQKKFHLISPAIRSLIEDKQGYLRSNPRYYLKMGSRTRKNLHEEATRHSLNLEMIGFTMRNSLDPVPRGELVKERKRCEENLIGAYTWAMNNYDGTLTDQYIREVARRVEPEINRTGFRTSNVKISGAQVSPPSAEKVQREIQIFLIEQFLLEDELERAVHAHFSIARIHPLGDGNGRTARLVQDTILLRANLPLVMIPFDERPEYINKIDAASASYRQAEGFLAEASIRKLDRVRALVAERNYRGTELAGLTKELMYERMTPEQNTFYDFLGSKVLFGLSKITEGLSGRR